MTKKIIVAHPEKQHSFRLAEAAWDARVLDKYITTAYYRRWNATSLLELATGGKLSLSKIRKMSFLPDDKVKQFNEICGLLLLVIRRTKLKKLTLKLQNYNFDRFGRKVAREALKSKVDAVVMYDTNSLCCFRTLRDQNIIRIMDTSIANRAYTKHIYESFVQTDDDWENFSESAMLKNDVEMKRLRDELLETDHFLVPSEFVKKSLVFSGADPCRIHVVPYGVDAGLFRFSERRKDIETGPLELLFVGQCSYRKGIHLLLEAVSAMTGKVNLTVAGGYQGIPDLYERYRHTENIRFLGRVQHDLLPEIYAQADCFILPSLSEGMSLVGLEAMASGLPLICSENTGVNDVVDNGVNGYVMEEISVKGITDAIGLLNDNRRIIPQMGIEARKTAEKYSWDYYKKNMQSALTSILGG